MLGVRRKRLGRAFPRLRFGLVWKATSATLWPIAWHPSRIWKRFQMDRPSASRPFRDDGTLRRFGSLGHWTHVRVVRPPLWWRTTAKLKNLANSFLGRSDWTRHREDALISVNWMPKMASRIGLGYAAERQSTAATFAGKRPGEATGNLATFGVSSLPGAPTQPRFC